MRRLILPTSKATLKLGNSFEWVINGKKKSAEQTRFQFYHDPIFDKKNWEFDGWGGLLDEGTLILFGFAIPYINDETFSKKYTAADRLFAMYGRALKLDNGFIELITLYPEGGSLDIETLNPTEGFVDGTFNALFHEQGHLLDVKVKFHLTRDDQ